MRRVVISFALIGILMGSVFMVHTQTETPEPAPEEDISMMATQIAEQAQLAIEEARSLNDFAFNLLGIFEAVSVAITIVGAALGLFGFGRLVSAENSLTAARREVEQELIDIRKQFQEERDALRNEFTDLSSEINKTVEEQRREAANATLATALLSFGERQYRAADFVGAVNTYERALELDSNNPVTYYRLGYVYTSQGELANAEKHLLKSLEIDYEFAPALVALGYVYRRMGEKLDEGIEREQHFNRAERHMLDGLKISPKLVDEDGESWWGSLGGLYRRRNQIAQAIYAYEQATQVTPHSSYPFGNLANLYGRENNVDGMLQMYRRVARLAAAEVQAEVDNYWGYFDLLTAHLALDHKKEAEDILPSVLETVPPDAVYALETLIDTLNRVAHVLENYPQKDLLLEYVQIITDYIKERKLKERRREENIRPEDTSAGIPVVKPEDAQPLGEEKTQ